jgi:hypothetical protein
MFCSLQEGWGKVGFESWPCRFRVVGFQIRGVDCEEMVAASHLTKDRNCSHEIGHVCWDVQQADPNLTWIRIILVARDQERQPKINLNLFPLSLSPLGPTRSWKINTVPAAALLTLQLKGTLGRTKHWVPTFKKEQRTGWMLYGDILNHVAFS